MFKKQTFEINHPVRSEFEEALERNQAQIISLAVAAFCYKFKENMEGSRGELEALLKKEDEHGMQDATLSIALLEAASLVAYQDHEDTIQKVEETDENAKNDSDLKDYLRDVRNYYGQFRGLRDALAAKHTKLAQLSKPFTLNSTESTFVENPSLIKKENLISWITDYIKQIEENKALAEVSPEHAQYWKEKEKREKPLLDVFVNTPERITPDQITQLIAIIEEQLRDEQQELVVSVFQYIKDPQSSYQKLERDIIDLTEERIFIAMLEGERAEKIALKK